MPEQPAGETPRTALSVHGNHTCADELVDYHEGSLTNEQGVAIELHLSGCAECSALAGNMFTSRGEYEQWLARHQRSATAG